MKDIISRSVAEHIDDLTKKEYSSAELTAAYLANMEKQEPSVNAYITVCADSAMDAAKLSDARRASGKTLSALDGVPFACKDNISTKGVRTTCASRMLENYIPPFDAHVVQRLYSMGFVMLGKTNLDEFAMGTGTETSAFGTTLNPHDLSRVSGGSSGGSAACVAANEAPWSLGSDTGGSVRQPASFCGVVGMRPTYSAISRYGLVGFAPSLDQIGHITKDVRDSALLLGALCGRDERDATSRAHPTADFTTQLGQSVKGLKIALIKETTGYGISAEVEEAINTSVKMLKAMGADVIELSLPHAKAAYAVYYILSSAEASSNLGRFDGVRYGYRSSNYTSTEELYRASRTEGFGAEVKRRILFGTMALSAEYCDDYYHNAQKMRSLITSDMLEALEMCDAMLLPTSPSVAYVLGEQSKDPFLTCLGDICCTLSALAGIPAMSIPYTLAKGLPVGIQLMGKQFSEPLLYRIAYALEKEMADLKSALCP